MATEDEIINVLKARDLYTDVTLTGRGALPGVFEMGGHHLQSGAGEGTIPLMRMYKVTKAMY